MTLLEYLNLVEWTGRQLHSGKRGSTKKSIPPLLDRLGTTREIRLEVVKKFEQRQQVKKSVLAGQLTVGRHGQVATVT